MGMTATDYRRQLLQLLPEGPVWPREVDTVIAKVLGATAEGFARVEQRSAALLNEADPRTTTEVLPDWERNFGLPDGCLPDPASAIERQRRLHQKVAWQGGQSRAFFIGLLDALGYPDCTITEYRPFRANSKCNDPLNQGGWRHAWRVNVPVAVDIKRMNVKSTCSAALATWGDPGLMCVLAKLKPAHTYLFIGYGVGEI